MTRQALEGEVVQILRRCELSGSPREVSIEDPLGELGLGLDSLALAEFIVALEKAYDVEIPETIWTEKRLRLLDFVDIIEQEGTPVGRLYVHRLHDEIRVIDIALLPEHRGRGLGGGLLRAVLEEAAAVGKSVYVSVERFNPAMRLYQRLGFVAITDEGVYRLMKWSPPTAEEPANPAKA